jgi:hypothetical protein
MIATGAGVVDADYRGPLYVLLFNHSDKEFSSTCLHIPAQSLLIQRYFSCRRRPYRATYSRKNRDPRGAGSRGMCIWDHFCVVSSHLCLCTGLRSDPPWCRWIRIHRSIEQCLNPSACCCVVMPATTSRNRRGGWIVVRAFPGNTYVAIFE